ncbi:MAG: M20/M25/M40 family metallo-hydrolase [Acidobacteriota bacterium]|nr:M20/M25/M40 family metallo-hydrolase [Acidobacteriota bacterium]MDH3525312.1 M20/M25/M40 family metallo-hydrolase [Acidobacteriota bacterium]
MDEKIRELAASCVPLAVEILEEAIRIPADFVDRPVAEGGDPSCGLSNHEGPRLEYLRSKIVEIGAADGPEDVAFDGFGNLRWTVRDPDDGIPDDEKSVVYFDGHTDTVQALRPRWHETIGGGIDPYLGLTDPERVDRGFLRNELGYLPPDDEWQHLVWGRGSADQLGGVVCQIMATRLLRALRPQGALRGVIVTSYATVAEEDNDGGGPMYLMRKDLPGAPASRIPDVLILSEPTGSAADGALGIYRGQRGRMQIEVEVTGKSCHGSMPWEGRNPLEFGSTIIAEAAAAYQRGEGFGDDGFLGPGTRTASFATLETPSDCAVPERFTFRLDRRLTAGEDPRQALADVEALPAVARARAAGLTVEVRAPLYDQLTWRGARPGNPQIYPGWVTPEDHPAIRAAAEAYRRVVTPGIAAGGTGGAMRPDPRVSRWVFSTDGVGVPVPRDSDLEVPATKNWVEAGAFRHPAMFGLGPGHEQNTHKIGECVDSRELAPVIAFYARFPSLYRALGRSSGRKDFK